MPNVATSGERPGLFVVMGQLNALENAFRGGDLVRTHHQQELFRGEDAETGKDIQQGMLGKERLGKIHKVGNDLVVTVRPVGCELKGVACLFALAPAAPALLPDMGVTGGIGVVFGVGAVGDDEYLDVLIQAGGSPKAVPLIALDLVEGFPDSHAAALELDVDHREAVDEHRHIIAGIVRPLRLFILVDDLYAVAMDILLVKQGDVLGRAVIPCQIKDTVFLYASGLFLDAFVGIGKMLGEELLPFLIGEGIVVEKFQLAAEIGDKPFLIVDVRILVALRAQLLDERLLQVGFALVEVGADFGGRVFGNHGAFGALCHHIETTHTASLKVRSLSR